MVELYNSRVIVTGGAGFLGSNIVNEVVSRHAQRVFVPRSWAWDLRHPESVRNLLRAEQPDIVIHAAAQAGGIGLNQRVPGELFYNNAIMGIQLMEAARKMDVKKFVQIGTVCSYPKFTSVPFKEINLWGGYPEETNAAYGLAKKMLLVQAQAYRQQYGFNAIYLMPVNLYGPHDNFSLDSSHVIPALIRKIVEAKYDGPKKVTIWGDGYASREFLYVEDCAEAIAIATDGYNQPEPLNIGSGEEITIRDLVYLLRELLDYDGEIVYDASKPNGQPRRRLDTMRTYKEIGWMARTSLREGLQKTIDWYLKEGK